MDETIMPVRLRLELVEEYLSDDEKRMLKRYGESSTGKSLSRDVLIPSDMTLHALHYMIQKLFGWQNSHLRRFVLPEKVYHELTGGTVKGWSDLVGVLFQPPSEAEEDLFWDDDYRSGSFPCGYGRNIRAPIRTAATWNSTKLQGGTWKRCWDILIPSKYRNHSPISGSAIKTIQKLNRKCSGKHR